MNPMIEILAQDANEITFDYGVMRNDSKGNWALFTLPVKDPAYLFNITKDHNFLNMPLWLPGNWKKVRYIPFEECLAMALEHEEFCANSEQF